MDNFIFQSHSYLKVRVCSHLHWEFVLFKYWEIQTKIIIRLRCHKFYTTHSQQPSQFYLHHNLLATIEMLASFFMLRIICCNKMFTQGRHHYASNGIKDMYYKNFQENSFWMIVLFMETSRQHQVGIIQCHAVVRLNSAVRCWWSIAVVVTHKLLVWFSHCTNHMVSIPS